MVGNKHEPLGFLFDEATRKAAMDKLYTLEMLRRERPGGLLTEDELALKAVLLETIEAEAPRAQHIRKED